MIRNRLFSLIGAEMRKIANGCISANKKMTDIERYGLPPLLEVNPALHGAVAMGLAAWQQTRGRTIMNKVTEGKPLSHQEAIIKAEQSVSAMRERAGSDVHRLKYHFMAPAYWINDPNGLIYYKGDYHLFYQHNPYAPVWGAMHWGHAKSKDLVHWEHLPIALAPSEEYDLHERGGCFSGSAVDDNGVLSVLYTGTAFADGKYVQTQCLATSRDGITFEKYAGNPVISAPPEDGSADFRDPKVWKHDNEWYMVVGSGKDGRGKALLYKSPDLRNWDYIGVLAESDGTMGTMWECPDFFPLGDRYVLMFSPMGMGRIKTVYLIGDMDYSKGKFNWDTMGEVDSGFEYYAPQSFEDDKGRRLMIAWANGWDWMPWFRGFGPTADGNWCGAMSTPRTVALGAGGRLKFEPIKELNTLRRENYHYKNLSILPGKTYLPKETGGECLEIMAEFQLTDCSAEEFGLTLRASEDRTVQTIIGYRKGSQELYVDRNRSDEWSEGINTVRVDTSPSNTLKLHILLDCSMVEVYSDEYRTVMSNNIYPDPHNLDVDVFSHGGQAQLISMEVWKLASIW